MGKVVNLKDVKRAKIHAEHLEEIIKVVNLSIKALSIFEVYTSVSSILNIMRQEKLILEKQLKLQKELLGKK